MILITVGSATYSFERLFRIIDELCDEGLLNGQDVVGQCGCTKYVPKNYKVFDMIESNEFKKMINKSDVIICHSGVGTIINAIEKGKKVIVFPRLKKYKEHGDDHQIEIAEMFSNNNYVKCASSKKELIEIIENIESFIPNKYVSNCDKINNLIIDFIEKGD